LRRTPTSSITAVLSDGIDIAIFLPSAVRLIKS
jgi:hypothetical protein